MSDRVQPRAAGIWGTSRGSNCRPGRTALPSNRAPEAEGHAQCIRAAMPKKEKRSKLRGQVLALNISPKGHIEGAVLETSDGRAQVNFPKHSAELFARATPVGANVELDAEGEPDEGEHPVYTALDAEDEISGTIVRLNYALHGEVNGYHLDDGTFVHVKPEGAKKYKLRVGDRVKASGTRRRGTDAVVLEVHALEKLGRRHEPRARA